MALTHATGGANTDQRLRKALEAAHENDQKRRSRPKPKPKPSYTPSYSAPSYSPKPSYPEPKPEKPDDSVFIDKINAAYDKSKSALLKSYMANQKNALRGLNQQKEEIGEVAYSNRNQTAVQRAQALKSLIEQMAAYGQAQSGENVSGRVALNSAYQNALGDINSAEQNALSDVSNQISTVTDPARKNSLIANLESARDQALASQMWNEHQAQLAEQARQESLAIQRQRIAAANARAAASARAAAQRAAAERAQAQDQMQYNHLMDIWQMTGVAPEGLQGVDPGTPLYEGSQVQEISPKESTDNYFSAVNQIKSAAQGEYDPAQIYGYAQNMRGYLTPNDYARLLQYVQANY